MTTFALDLGKPPVRMPAMPEPPPVRVVRNGVTIDPPLVPVTGPSRWWCFFGVHDFEIIDTGRWKQNNEWGREVACGTKYFLRCKVCGKIKAKCV